MRHLFSLRMFFCLFVFAAASVVLYPAEVKAANLFFKGGDIELSQPKDSQIWIYTGYSGKFIPAGGEDLFSVKKTGAIILEKDGSYKAKKPGRTVISAWRSDRPGEKHTYTISVVDYPKSFSISPSKRTITGPCQDARHPMRTSFKLRGVRVDKNSPVEFSFGEDDMEPSISRRGQTVYLSTANPGISNITVNFAGVEKTFRWTMNGIGVKDGGSLLLSPKEQEKLVVDNSRAGRFEWTTSDKGIATVSADGRVLAKKFGNAIITGVEKNRGYRVGCVVSVAPEAKINAIKRGKKIAEGTYSLSRRMQQGYYDCSSLVWRAYVQEGVNFGVPLGGYAPVAGTECQYLERRGRIVSTWKPKDMEKMKYLAGDLMFRTNTGNGHYRGIDHVEMIAGYTVSYNTKKKPVPCCVWVNRPAEYSYTINAWDMIGRP